MNTRNILEMILQSHVEIERISSVTESDANKGTAT